MGMIESTERVSDEESKEEEVAGDDSDEVDEPC